MGKGLMMLGRVLDWEGLLQEVCVGGDACVGGAFWLELPLLALSFRVGRRSGLFTPIPYLQPHRSSAKTRCFMINSFLGERGFRRLAGGRKNI